MNDGAFSGAAQLAQFNKRSARVNRLFSIASSSRYVCDALWQAAVMLCAMFVLCLPAFAANVDLVINIDSDKPSYKANELQTFTFTVTNNGPDAATAVALKVNHPSATLPFDTTAACTFASAGAVCPTVFFGLPSLDLTTTIPLIPNQGRVVIVFQVLPTLVCRQIGSIGAEQGPCVPTDYETGRLLITAQATNGATEGKNVTNVASTNITLYQPPIGYKMVITKSPVGALTQGMFADYEFEVQSIGSDPSGPLRLALNAFPAMGSSANTGGAGYAPGTTLLSLECVSVTPVPGPSVPANSVLFGGQGCPSINTLPIPSPGPTTTLSDVLQGFTGSAFLVDLPGPSGVAKFKARILVGRPKCAPTSGPVSRTLTFGVQVNGATEAPLISTFVDNNATTSNTITGTCLEADITTALSVTPMTVTSTNPSANKSTLNATFSNISVGAGAGTATNVPFTIGTGAHPSWLGPITAALATAYCTPSGGATCPPIGSIVITPTGSSSAKTISGTIPSLPPGASVIISVDVTEGNVQPLCTSAGILVAPFASALPDATLTDPNYNPSTSPTTWVNNRAVSSLTVNVLGSAPGLPPCVGSGVSGGPLVNITKAGAFSTNTGSDTPIGASAGGYVAPGTVVYAKIVVLNVGGVAADIASVNDFASFATALGATGGFTSTGAAASLADWGVTCVASAGATCFDAASSSSPGPYKSAIKLAYSAAASATGNVPLPIGGSLTFYVPFKVPAPSLSAALCTAFGGNTASLNAPGAAFVNSSAVVPIFVYTGYAACDTKLSITKTVIAPATASSIPASGLVSYSVVVKNLSTTQTIGVPRFADTPTLTTTASATSATVSIACGSPTLAAVCPSSISMPIGTQVRVVGPTSPIGPNDVDFEWGAVSAPTMPPGSSLTFTVTVQLSAPTKRFNGINNVADFKAENEPLTWAPVQANASIFVSPSPQVSVQKRVATQIVAGNTFAQFTVDVVSVTGALATNILLIDNLSPVLAAANPLGYSLVTCSDLSTAAFIPLPKAPGICPATVSSTPAGLNMTIPALGTATAPNSGVRFTYRALMPANTVSVENFVTVTPQSSGGGLLFSAGAAQAHANVQVLGAPIIAATGSLTITKLVTGGPVGLFVGGPFSFALNCPLTGPVPNQQIASAGGSVIVSGLTVGDTCSVTEIAPLPAPPGGYSWGALPGPLTSAAITVAGVAVTVTNTLSLDPVTPPAMVPGNSAWQIALLAALLAGFAGALLRRRN